MKKLLIGLTVSSLLMANQAMAEITMDNAKWITSNSEPLAFIFKNGGKRSKSATAHIKNKNGSNTFVLSINAKNCDSLVSKIPTVFMFNKTWVKTKAECNESDVLDIYPTTSNGIEFVNNLFINSKGFVSISSNGNSKELITTLGYEDAYNAFKKLEDEKANAL